MADSEGPEIQLANYLQERLKRIQACYIDLENKISDDERELNEGINNNTIDNVGFSYAYKHINLSVRSTFRYAMLIAVCSFVEEALVQIVKIVDDDYDKHIKGTNRKNRAKVHIDLLSTHFMLETTPIASELEILHNLIILRNCVVHSWGNITEDRNPKQVEKAVVFLKTSGLEGNFDIIETTVDDYLVFGDHIISHAIIKSMVVINHVLKSVLKERIVLW